MSIPLVQNNEKDSINTSIIAIKRNIERINMLLGLSNSEEIDTSKFATKEELQQTVTDLQPVDEVTADNMHSVTSNAVAESLSYSTTEQKTGGYWIDGKPIYRKVWTNLNYTLLPNDWFATDISNSGYDTITEIKVMNNVGTLFNFVGCSRDIGNTLQLWSTRNVNVEMNILVLEYTKTTD